MKKVLIVSLIIIVGIGGYLGWDWYNKMEMQKLEPSVTLYYWTDAKGNKHFSDSPPPTDASNIYTQKGYKYINPPLIVVIKDKVVEYYKKAKDTLFKPKKTKQKRKK